MFLRSRIVAVDDKENHLTGLKIALNSLCMDCHAIKYEDETVAGWKPLPATRILFLDLNLRAGATFNTPNAANFATIADVLIKLIHPESGPYGLVLWAEQPLLDDLLVFLNERLTGAESRYLPVFAQALRKGDYINTGDGTVINAQRLKDDIVQAISINVQMKALFSWEADVIAAMDATLRSIVDLVPEDKRTSAAFSEELGKILFRISQAGGGINRAFENPRESVNSVLVPVLADRISQHDPDGESSASWKSALVEDKNKSAPEAVQAAVNTAIHISTAASSLSVPIRATDLGAVITSPFETDEKLLENFGITVAELRDVKFFGVTNDVEWSSCKLRLVQIGASCDHAQPKPGPLLYLLAIEWPFSVGVANASLRANKTTKVDYDYRTPVLLVGDQKKPGRISVFLNLSLSVPKTTAQQWNVAYRFRDELISNITQEYSRYIARPGLTNL